MQPGGGREPGITVLLVDDEPPLLEIGRRFLERAGDVRVTTALSAPDAIRLLLQAGYDAIVSDYQMPEVNGIEFLRQIRAAGDQTPFIIFTGKGREEVAIEALNSGADFYLQKGGDPKAQFAELFHVIRQAVGRRRSELALSEMQQRTAEILEFLPDATFAIDTHGVVIAWNHAMEVMTGVKKEDILNSGDYSYAIPFYGERRPILIDLIFGDREIIAAKYPYIREEGCTFFSEIFIPHLNYGKGVHLWFTASPLYDSAGNIAGAIESIRDITDRKQAEEAVQRSETQYRLLAENAADLIYRIDLFPTRHFSYVSPSAAAITGYTPEEHYADPDLGFRLVHPDDRPLLDKMANREVISERPIVLRWVRKDGTVIWTEQRNVPVVDHNGMLVAIEGIARDITDRKQAEEALRESESRYRFLTERMNDIVFTQDLALQTTFVSPSVENVLGFTPEERIKQDLAGQVTPASLAVIRETFARELTREQAVGADPGRSITLEVEYYHKNGSTRWCEIVVSGIRDERGALTGFHGVARDITNRRAAEAALRESEKRFRALFEESPVPYQSLDAAGRFIAVNTTWLETLGYSRDDVIGHWFGEFLAPEHRKLFTEQFPLFRASGRTRNTQFLMQRKDGSTILASFDGRVAFNPDGSFRQTHCIFQDITRTTQVRKDLERSEGEKALILSSITDMVAFYASPDLRITWANRASGDSVSCESAEMGGHHCYTIWHQRDTPCEPCPVLAAFSTGESQEMEVTTPDGRVWLLRAFPARDDRGALTGVVEIGREITALKKADEALRESREQYRDLAENAPIGILTCDREGRITFVNQRVLGMLGSPGEAETRAINLLQFPPLVKAGFADLLKKTLDGGATIGAVELEYTSHWSRTAWYRGHISPIIRDGLVTGARITLDDISERKGVEEALRATNRKLHLLSSITRHDTNNQLLVITGFLDLLQSEAADPGLREYFTRITGASEKIATIMRFTKVYEAVGMQTPLWQDVYFLVEHAAAEIPPDLIRLVNDILPGVEVSADPLIEKVFSNLVDNAIRYGETITMIRFRGREENGMYLIVCEDDGIGIPAADKEKIFLHGFGRNTGLGLFLAREILAITGITIRETGEQGKGARFEMVVPPGRYRVRKSEDGPDAGSPPP